MEKMDEAEIDWNSVAQWAKRNIEEDEGGKE